jgi:hypothetical protein
MTPRNTGYWPVGFWPVMKTGRAMLAMARSERFSRSSPRPTSFTSVRIRIRTTPTPGQTVTWTYAVTNDGTVDISEADITVTDNIVGPISQIINKGDNDAILSPGETWIYAKTGIALDLATASGPNIVPNQCHQGNTGNPGGNAYTNQGTVTIPSMSASDPSSYCNPPGLSKSITIGPSSMEGAIKIDAGDWVNGGYSFKTNFSGNITIAATVSITGKCLGGSLPSDTLTVNLGSVSYAAVAGSAGSLPATPTAS